ncbi:hypothetical protein [Nocardioides humilatus]|nr:hypothetical protein [Nocardioides humilatus]
MSPRNARDRSIRALLLGMSASFLVAVGVAGPTPVASATGAPAPTS